MTLVPIPSTGGVTPPSEPVGVAPSNLTTVAAGMQSDVVEPLSKAMRAFDPDAAIPPNALGQIGVAALAQYYTPTFNHECDEFRQGWRTAGDIATAVRSCANTYTSTEETITAYTRTAASQLLQQAYDDADQSELQAWGSTGTAPNTAAPSNGAVTPELLPGLLGDLNFAAIEAPELETKLKNAGATLLEIANALHIPAGKLPEVGQSQWSTAIFDASSLVTALAARDYAQETVTSISNGAMPGIQTALARAWTGPAWDTAYPVIEKFGAAVTAAGTRAQTLLGIFEAIMNDYHTFLQQAVYSCTPFFPALQQLQVDVRGHEPIPANPSGNTAVFVRQAAGEVSRLTTGFTTAVATAVPRIQHSIETTLALVNNFNGPGWVSFPVITSGNDLPDAHTSPPKGRMGPV